MVNRVMHDYRRLLFVRSFAMGSRLAVECQWRRM